MTENSAHGSNQSLSAGVILWLIVSWIWVGVPLGWGVWKSVERSRPLFQQAAPDVKADSHGGTSVR